MKAANQQAGIAMEDAKINAYDDLPRKKIKVLDSEMSYVDTGKGDPVVFLHGNPTSSYLWRNIIPFVSKYRRCLAPDLIGMGQSGKSPDKKYKFTDHAVYLDAWFDAIDLKRNIVFVLHDWGSALGFHRIYHYSQQVKAIVYMESIVRPITWEDFAHGRDAIFRALRSEKGEQMVMEENFFIETVLPRSILRKLTDEEMNAYREPFKNKEDRLPTLIFPRELPINGEPEDVSVIVEKYSSWLATTNIPKLLISAEPGALLTGRSLEFCRTWRNQREVRVKGIHYLQEDSPLQIGEAIREFILNDLQ
jgi:haloalkane dehalogenase